ncbi:MAG: pyridoxine 5'-phosphate synthase [Elusimicrobiales bacterium]|nr:pyridoxine 5'-phosphate synthase [Elusimicrobiales bacterium]
MNNVKLGINIDHIATLRQARGGNEPDPVVAARIILEAGADRITMHYRADRKHIQLSDLAMIRREVPGQFHLEVAPIPEMEEVVLSIMPDSVCLVPEQKEDVSEGGGLLLGEHNMEQAAKMIKAFSEAGIETGVYCDPVPQAIRAAHKIGADTISLSTVKYAEAMGKKNQAAELEKLQLAAYLVKELKKNLEAGGELSYHNIAAVASIPDMNYVSAGFSVIAKALFCGLKEAVAEIKDIVEA